jgi:hypothetical protein
MLPIQTICFVHFAFTQTKHQDYIVLNNNDKLYGIVKHINKKKQIVHSIKN